MANAGLTLHHERRRCEYRDHNTLKMRIGHCLLIHGNGGGLAYAVIEKDDGRMEDVLIDNVRFLDIAPPDAIPLPPGGTFVPMLDTTAWIAGKMYGHPNGRTVYSCAKCHNIIETPTRFCCDCGRRALEGNLPQ